MFGLCLKSPGRKSCVAMHVLFEHNSNSEDKLGAVHAVTRLHSRVCTLEWIKVERLNG